MRTIAAITTLAPRPGCRGITPRPQSLQLLACLEECFCSLGLYLVFVHVQATAGFGHNGWQTRSESTGSHVRNGIPCDIQDEESSMLLQTLHQRENASIP